MAETYDWIIAWTDAAGDPHVRLLRGTQAELDQAERLLLEHRGEGQIASLKIAPTHEGFVRLAALRL